MVCSTTWSFQPTPVDPSRWVAQAVGEFLLISIGPPESAATEQEELQSSLTSLDVQDDWKSHGQHGIETDVTVGPPWKRFMEVLSKTVVCTVEMYCTWCPDVPSRVDLNLDF